MATKILIDAAYPEETRVAVVDGNRRLVTLDYDSKSNGQISGNIYLATVVRVEPALQAAFVDYGGARHGFLAFSEIHPDYYQIPDRGQDGFGDDPEAVEDAEVYDAEESAASSAADLGDGVDDEPLTGDELADAYRDVPSEQSADETREAANGDTPPPPKRKAAPESRYLIQEVIRNRQILLVQVAKEPRGDKGAALTTYISLAGRYCVLMPNAGHRAGGISRKIGSAEDRKRLKAIAQELEVPDHVGMIVRTAGSGRAKADIKRDYTSLLELWESIRQNTLDSRAPCLVHDESNMVRRTVRDLYSKDVKEVQVEGEEAFQAAQQYVHEFVSPQAKNVRQHRGKKRLFETFGVEEQINALFEPKVQLPSGGSIVIAQTEALTAIDVNSGRATRERQVEKTAVRTNLEAAEEIPRQLRLRDLAGLIVVDFIDMDEERNRRSVEARFREQLRPDRARVQVGGISGFGLLEMSRQRLRRGMLELSVVPCETCSGTGYTRSGGSAALSVVRQLDEWLGAGRRRDVVELQAAVGVANCLYNEMRSYLTELETRFGIVVKLLANPTLSGATVKMQWVEVDGQTDERVASPAPRRRASRSEGAKRERPRTRSKSADRPATPVRHDDESDTAAAPKPARRRRRRTTGADDSEVTGAEQPAAVMETARTAGDDDEASPRSRQRAREIFSSDHDPNADLRGTTRRTRSSPRSSRSDYRARAAAQAEANTAVAGEESDAGDDFRRTRRIPRQDEGQNDRRPEPVESNDAELPVGRGTAPAAPADASGQGEDEFGNGSDRVTNRKPPRTRAPRRVRTKDTTAQAPNRDTDLVDAQPTSESRSSPTAGGRYRITGKSTVGAGTAMSTDGNVTAEDDTRSHPTPRGLGAKIRRDDHSLAEARHAVNDDHAAGTSPTDVRPRLSPGGGTQSEPTVNRWDADGGHRSGAGHDDSGSGEGTGW